jgi:hypothetical protein
VFGSRPLAAFGLEEAVGGVDGSVAAAQGERDRCDVRGGKRLGTGVFGNPSPGRGSPWAEDCCGAQWGGGSEKVAVGSSSGQLGKEKNIEHSTLNIEHPKGMEPKIVVIPNGVEGVRK